MICVRLAGGLGNQMFQYACGRALAVKHKTELLLDCTVFQNKTIDPNLTFREYELDIFKINAREANLTELAKFRPSFSYRAYKALSRRVGLPIFANPNYLLEQSEFKYNIAIEKLSKNCLLVGNWQNEQFFKCIEPIIQQDFTFQETLDQNNTELATRIEAVNSVSLHVRRGDFANNLATFSTHGLCSIGYYQEAINYMNTKVRNPVFFIFSDDMEWAKTNIKTKSNCEFVSGNTGKHSYVDMQLMSLCKHNIIANSTFSWWGAWLNKNPDKIVVAPKQWFLKEDLNQLTENFILQTWIRL